MRQDLLPVETLEKLSRQEGVDVRPILLRVLTDLFVQKTSHAPEELARYEELTLQLLDVVDVETREMVASKLAGDPRTPAPVIDRLLTDEMISVSIPVIARFPDLPRERAIMLAMEGPTAAAVAVASRPEIDPDVCRILARHEDDIVVETLVANPNVKLSEQTLVTLVDRARQTPSLAVALLGRDDIDSQTMAPLYLHAIRERRAAIRKAMAGRPLGSARTLRVADAKDTELVATAGRSGQGELVAEALSYALGVKPRDAGWLATEPSGEPFVLLLRAAGVETDAIARALLLCQPEIARSVPRFFELVEMAETTPRAVAADLVAAMVGGEPSSGSTAKHEPLLDPSGVKERAGASRAAPRTIRRPFARPAETRQRS